ncbi:CYFA0S01e09868g1_1 [Cyberlindnera fabianii]|uniref:CYFA0S01e09868g1_1 n=1 Tax=Cyberlindnera fabianii TaxID=36022 RepID=A0A061ARK3_CYBFA|nr:CYFA0S01e09868g1_1 [Cyberlindnera fabianii]
MSEEALSAKDSLKDLLFGSLSGCVGKTIEYPFDTIKVRLQSQPHGQPLIYNSTWDCIRKTVRSEGLTGFYRGVSSPIVGAAAENATLFFSYGIAQDVIKKYVVQTKGDLPLPYLVLCGGISGVVASYVLTPIELIKCKMQVEQVYSGQGKPNTVLGHIKHVWKMGGLKGFWFGQTGTLLREAGGSASWFGVYELVSKTLKEWRLGRRANSDDTNTIGELLFSGASAGIAYNLSLFPADTVKSTMQTGSIVNPEQKPMTFQEAARTIYKHGGVKSFYRGLGITLARAIPSNAAIFFTYEGLKNHFK